MYSAYLQCITGHHSCSGIVDPHQVQKRLRQFFLELELIKSFSASHIVSRWHIFQTRISPGRRNYRLEYVSKNWSETKIVSRHFRRMRVCLWTLAFHNHKYLTFGYCTGGIISAPIFRELHEGRSGVKCSSTM
jgi:hypothetical protein